MQQERLFFGGNDETLKKYIDKNFLRDCKQKGNANKLWVYFWLDSDMQNFFL